MTDGKPREVHDIKPFDLNPDMLTFDHGNGSGTGLMKPKLTINGKDATHEEVLALLKAKGKVTATHRHHVDISA